MFDIRARGSSVQREILGGLTTFMAMSYILFVQPAVLSAAGMDPGGVFMATCMSAAGACVLMGLLANYPIALAPGMGENFYFVSICGVGAAAGALVLHWSEALALVMVSGALFMGLSALGVRSKVLEAIPNSLKNGIAAGIGLFITLIGLQWGNIVTSNEATFVTLAPMNGNVVALLTVIGLAIMLALTAIRLHGAILIGILATTGLTYLAGQIGWISPLAFRGVVDTPHGLGETAGQFVGGFGGLWRHLTGGAWVEVLTITLVLLLMDMFDTVGTLVGVASRAGLMTGGKLPRGNRALAADAGGTMLGAALGSSTVTSYIESITGVASGARTGLAALVTAACLLAAMVFQPLVEMVGGGVVVGEYSWGAPILRYPMIAAALIMVGALMIRTVREIDWEDITEALPAFLTMVMMPLAYSISAGIGAGFISYAAGKVLTGRAKECPVLVYVFAALFVVRFLAA